MFAAITILIFCLIKEIIRKRRNDFGILQHWSTECIYAAPRRVNHLEMELNHTQQASQTPVMGLGPDILPYIMSIIPASRHQIAHLITLREVCKDFKQAVDNCRENHEWTGRFSAQAADFRNDVARIGNVHPPLLLNRGIARMIIEKQWQPLIDGMREYNSDCITQEIIITRCMQTLTPGIILNRAMQLAGVVAWAMRSHPNSYLVQQNGCRLLQLIVHEDDELHITQYIVGTLAVVMHANMQNVELLQMCMYILYKMLFQVPHLASEAEDASDSDGDDASDDAPMPGVQSGARDVVNMSALMQAGVHNVPTLLIRIMRQHMDDFGLQEAASEAFFVYSGIMKRLKDRTCMKDFVMHEAQTVLIASMHTHLHRVRSDFTHSVQQNCIMALENFMDFDFSSMRHVERAMQVSINAALQDRGEESMDCMRGIFSKIMEKLENSPVETELMQKFAANSAMVQIFIMYICDPEFIALQDERDTLHAFELVTLICDGNAYTSARMVQADVMRTIDGASPHTLKTAHWHRARDRLVAILE